MAIISINEKEHGGWKYLVYQICLFILSKEVAPRELVNTSGLRS